LKLHPLLLAAILLAGGPVLPASAATVAGSVLYEKIPATLSGLDIANPQQTPVAGVRVDLRNAQDVGTIVAQGTTDEQGGYRFEVPDSLTSELILVIWAVSGKIVVGNPANNQIWYVTSPAFSPSRPPRLVIPDRNRLSGPFNILAAIRRANRALRQVEPELPLDDIQMTIFWAPRNYRVTSFFDVANNLAYILGDRGEDSDEFDDSVIIHEYAHYLARRFSRDDSPLGEHYFGERLDPRLAWSEGFANFFAQAVLGHPRYIDTMGPDGGDVLVLDLDRDVAEGDTPGYWSEDTVGSVLWDLYADAGTGSGSIGLGLAPIWRVLRDYFPRQVFPYLITLADGLIQQDPSRQDAVTALLARRGILYSYGVNPPVSDPFPRRLSPGQTATGHVQSHLTRRWNLIDAAHYYSFRLESPTDVDIRLRLTSANLLTGAANLVLALYDQSGARIAVVDEVQGVNSTERLARRLPAGAYVIGVESYLQSAEGVRYGQGNYELRAEY
jgi:hypothetical protein